MVAGIDLDQVAVAVHGRRARIDQRCIGGDGTVLGHALLAVAGHHAATPAGEVEFMDLAQVGDVQFAVIRAEGDAVGTIAAFLALRRLPAGQGGHRAGGGSEAPHPAVPGVANENLTGRSHRQVVRPVELRLQARIRP